MDLKKLKDTPPWEWSADTGRALLGVIGDKQAEPSDRLLAVELAGDYTVVNTEIIERLLAVLSAPDEPEKLRCQAAISMGPALEDADMSLNVEGDADMTDIDDAEEEPLSGKTFEELQQTLRALFADADVPASVRRSVLEVSVRAPRDWHQAAVGEAYSGKDEAWRRTAVFCMGHLPGFERQILEALDNPDPDVHYQAVCAAGNEALERAWKHVVALATSNSTEKTLRLAAIDAVASIRPDEASEVLGALTDSKDEDIAAVAFEALAEAEGLMENDEDDER